MSRLLIKGKRSNNSQALAKREAGYLEVDRTERHDNELDTQPVQ